MCGNFFNQANPASPLAEPPVALEGIYKLFFPFEAFHSVFKCVGVYKWEQYSAVVGSPDLGGGQTHPSLNSKQSEQ